MRWRSASAEAMLRSGLLLHAANGQRVFAEHFDSPRHAADLVRNSPPGIASSSSPAASDCILSVMRRIGPERLLPISHAKHGTQQQRAGRAPDHRLLRLLNCRRGLLTLFGARCAKLRADLADLLVDRGAGFHQIGLLRAQIAGHLDHLVQRSGIGGDRRLQCRNQRLQFRLCRTGNFGLCVADCERGRSQREFCIVGVRRRQRVPIAHHRDP